MSISKCKCKRYVAVLAILLFLSVAPVVKAATVDFNITVTSNQLNQDPKSKRVLKNTDGSTYFYVTPSYFSRSGSIRVRSVQLDNKKIASGKHLISSKETGSKKIFTYDKAVAGGVYYYMESFYAASSGNSINVKGRYTP